MSSSIKTFSIMLGSLSCFTCFILIVCLIRHYRQINREKNNIDRLINIRRKLTVSHKVKPIFQMTDEELKDEFEKRTPEITAEENV